MVEAARRLVVAGVTTRPLAVSAARAGWKVTAADAFGDLDLLSRARVLTLGAPGAPFEPAAAARAARGVSAAFAAYTSSFENHPDAVAALARGRRLLGNSPAVLRRVRDPLALMRTLGGLGLETPLTRAAPPRAPLDRDRRWLLKPRRSGGGHGTSPWRPGRRVGRHQYLQERIPGRPGSVVVLADGRDAHVLGISRQLVGRPEFGARGFRYCGSLMGPDLFSAEPALHRRTQALAAAVARGFGLVGLNGVDFIARSGIPWPIEVNPRFSASMELLERGAGLSLFALHAAACAGQLPGRATPWLSRVHGKAIVYARRDVTPRATRRWLADPAMADIPPPGKRIARGRPICTVFATGRDAESCTRALVAKARSVYRALEPAAGGVA
jgi:predicted ATP-grasp superfamily ATP-dependent carboligase